RKTIAQGRPDDPPVPVVLPRAFCCTRTMGAVGTRPSLRPLFFRGRFASNDSDISCRENADSCQQSCPGPSFETRRDRAAPQDEVVYVARIQTLVVRRRANAVSGRCFASPGEPRSPAGAIKFCFSLMPHSMSLESLFRKLHAGHVDAVLACGFGGA